MAFAIPYGVYGNKSRLKVFRVCGVMQASEKPHSENHHFTIIQPSATPDTTITTRSKTKSVRRFMPKPPKIQRLTFGLRESEC
jgi:hypothetical protein